MRAVLFVAIFFSFFLPSFGAAEDLSATWDTAADCSNTDIPFCYSRNDLSVDNEAVYDAAELKVSEVEFQNGIFIIHFDLLSDGDEALESLNWNNFPVSDQVVFDVRTETWYDICDFETNLGASRGIENSCFDLTS